MIQEFREQLDQATEQLYSVFGAYPLKPKIFGCDHCVFPEDDAKIRSAPLRELTWDTLQKFSHKAMTTWGDKDDFKHFMPRILELISEGNNWPISIDRVIPSKLIDAGWLNWPEVEVEAVTNYTAALWSNELARGCTDITADEMLYSVVQAGMDLRLFLNTWYRALLTGSSGPILYLIDFIDAVQFATKRYVRNDLPPIPMLRPVPIGRSQLFPGFWTPV